MSIELNTVADISHEKCVGLPISSTSETSSSPILQAKTSSGSYDAIENVLCCSQSLVVNPSGIVSSVSTSKSSGQDQSSGSETQPFMPAVPAARPAIGAPPDLSYPHVPGWLPARPPFQQFPTLPFLPPPQNGWPARYPYYLPPNYYPVPTFRPVAPPPPVPPPPKRPYIERDPKRLDRLKMLKRMASKQGVPFLEYMQKQHRGRYFNHRNTALLAHELRKDATSTNNNDTISSDADSDILNSSTEVDLSTSDCSVDDDELNDIIDQTLINLDCSIPIKEHVVPADLIAHLDIDPRSRRYKGVDDPWHNQLFVIMQYVCHVTHRYLRLYHSRFSLEKICSLTGFRLRYSQACEDTADGATQYEVTFYLQGALLSSVDRLWTDLRARLKRFPLVRKHYEKMLSHWHGISIALASGVGTTKANAICDAYKKSVTALLQPFVDVLRTNLYTWVLVTYEEDPSACVYIEALPVSYLLNQHFSLLLAEKRFVDTCKRFESKIKVATGNDETNSTCMIDVNGLLVAEALAPYAPLARQWVSQVALVHLRWYCATIVNLDCVKASLASFDVDVIRLALEHNALKESVGILECRIYPPGSDPQSDIRQLVSRWIQANEATLRQLPYTAVPADITRADEDTMEDEAVETSDGSDAEESE